MVTHLTTNPPVSCLNRAERTGSLVFMILWSYVQDVFAVAYFIQCDEHQEDGQPISHGAVCIGMLVSLAIICALNFQLPF
jgi:hypothetical protein